MAGSASWLVAAASPFRTDMSVLKSSLLIGISSSSEAEISWGFTETLALAFLANFDVCLRVLMTHHVPL